MASKLLKESKEPKKPEKPEKRKRAQTTKQQRQEQRAQQRLQEAEEQEAKRTRDEAAHNALCDDLMARWKAAGKPVEWFVRGTLLICGNPELYDLLNEHDDDLGESVVYSVCIADACKRAPFWSVYGDNSVKQLGAIESIAKRVIPKFQGPNATDQDQDKLLLLLVRTIAAHMMGTNKLAHLDSCKVCVLPGLRVPFCPQYPGRRDRHDDACFSRLLTLVIVVMDAGITEADDLRSMLDVLIPPTDDTDGEAKADDDDDDDDEEAEAGVSGPDEDYKLLASRGLRDALVNALLATAKAVDARMRSMLAQK
jgi:hypothetical protein